MFFNHCPSKRSVDPAIGEGYALKSSDRSPEKKGVFLRSVKSGNVAEVDFYAGRMGYVAMSIISA